VLKNERACPSVATNTLSPLVPSWTCLCIAGILMKRRLALQRLFFFFNIFKRSFPVRTHSASWILTSLEFKILTTEGSGNDNRDGFAAGLRCIGCISLSGEVRWPVCPERGRASSILQWFAPAMLRTSTADSIALTSRVLRRVCCSCGVVTEPSSTLAVATRACMSD